MIRSHFILSRIVSSVHAATARAAGPVWVVVGLLAMCLAGDARAQVCTASDCLPPANSAYTGIFHQNYFWFGLPVDLTNPIHDSFTACDPPPPSGGTTVHSFSSLVHGVVMVGPNPPLPFTAPAMVTVAVHSTGTIGTTRFFDTEMLQLDISGGTLPPGAIIRESPTLSSLGKSDITPVQGGFAINSFFDIFTELSLDGGQNWAPSQSPPGRMTATQPGCPVPAQPGTWGSLKAVYR